jgi:hypothetical protein
MPWLLLYQLTNIRTKESPRITRQESPELARQANRSVTLLLDKDL